MILTKKQEEGLKIAVDRYKNREAWTCIAGYAGTGKSMTAEAIAEYLNKKCAEIDKLIADKTRLLEEMESYKKSVIYEYVTGKKQV